MSTTTDVRIARHDADDARDLAEQLGALYAAAYVGTPQETDPFYSAERFAERLHGYAAAPGFRLITAETGGELIGYAFGYLLPAGARWWNGLQDDVPADMTAESGRRTFALCELHVRADQRGHGVASRLHQQLAAGDHERLTVLVRPDNPALAVYQRWGYRQLGRLQPYPDSPVYLALLLHQAEQGSRS
jgi:ribosomal protein S18 acetylase RimI-like enzyme